MTEPARHHRGVYAIGEDYLARLLQLPDGQQVRAMSIDWPRGCLLVMVEGPGLPSVVAGNDAPVLNEWGQLGPLAALDVSKLTPGAAHAAILAELAQVRLEDPAALAGRHRILDRHGPRPERSWLDRCSSCTSEIDAEPDEWPCPDYLDAAAGLVTGLPGQAEYAAAYAAVATVTQLALGGVMPAAEALAILTDATSALDAAMLRTSPSAGPDTAQES